MELTTDKARFIRDEFACFVRIGLDSRVRARLMKTIEQSLVVHGQPAFTLNIYIELRGEDGTLREMWILECDSEQMLRLFSFLQRFSVEDVRLIDEMMRA